MHQNYVTSRCSVLGDLEWYPVDLFDALVEARDTRSGISRSIQIPEVRVPLERSTELRSPGPLCWWIFRKPLMHETMRAAEDVRAAATWSDVRQHRVYLHATGG